MTGTDLFVSRLRDAWSKGARYFAVIAKGLHFLPLVALILTTYGYQTFLDWLPPDFPVHLLLAALITPVLTQTGVRTFLREADPHFLYPAQSWLRSYFRLVLLYSVVVQTWKVVAWMGLWYKLYTARLGEAEDFAWALGIVIVLKWWNVHIRWQELFVADHPLSARWFRLGTNGTAALWLFGNGLQNLLLPALALWLGAVVFHYRNRRQAQLHLIPWNRLLSLEEQTVAGYHRLAAYFVDVPRIGNPVKPRRWLSFLYRWIPKDPDRTYLHLYLRTFFRRTEPFGASIRITLVIAAVLAIGQPGWAGSLILIWTALFMTAVQLPWIRKIHRFQPWLHLYPLPDRLKQTHFNRLAMVLLGIQSSVLVVFRMSFGTLPASGMWTLLASGWAASVFFGYGFLPWHMRKSRSLIL